AEALQRVDEVLDVGLADEAHARLGVGKRDAPPVIDQPGPDGREPAERLVPDVHELLAGGQEAGVGRRDGADLLLLLGGQGAMHAPPVQHDPHGRGETAQALGRALGVQRDVADSYGAHGSPLDCVQLEGKRPAPRGEETGPRCTASPLCHKSVVARAALDAAAGLRRARLFTAAGAWPPGAGATSVSPPPTPADVLPRPP